MGISNKICISDKVYIKSKDCKGLNYIICFNHKKKKYYTNTCTKPRKNFDISSN